MDSAVVIVVISIDVFADIAVGLSDIVLVVFDFIC